MRNHGHIAQARRDFLNGLKFTVTAPNEAIPFYYKKGQLFSPAGAVADVIGVNDEYFHIVTSKHLNFNTYYFHEINFLPGISKADFLTGRAFRYSGHFQTLTRNLLHYDAIHDQVKDERAQLELDLITVEPTGFSLFTRKTGKIIIDFRECELEVPNA